MAIRYQRRCKRDHVWVARPFRTELLHAGDVGYIRRVRAFIENVGSERSRTLIAFNTGIYESIDLSPGLPAIQWMFSRQILQT